MTEVGRAVCGFRASWFGLQLGFRFGFRFGLMMRNPIYSAIRTKNFAWYFPFRRPETIVSTLPIRQYLSSAA